jgi:selenide,water dikinase
VLIPASPPGAPVKNLEKRRRVMQRSMRLGHCICDPKMPCPCDLLRDQDVCLCAGERLDTPNAPVRLTRLVEKAGCASKIDQAALRTILDGLPKPQDPRVLVGVPAGDDAGVFLLNGDRRAWVQTVDVFSPSVDDPYLFGQVAAANSVSDVYAMGAVPLTALSIIGFPIREAPDHVMRDILRGGLDKMAEAGVAVIGGHSIQDKEIKAGFAVTGLVDPAKIVTNAGARPGDALVLTKPIGTGIIAFAAQIDRAPAGAVEAAAASMSALNKTASALMSAFDAHACTDVTGFGLMGHLAAMAEASRVDVEVVWDDLPLLPGVLECLTEGIVPGAVERNRESAGSRVAPGPAVTAPMLDLCFDPQTSGGLLIAVPAPRADGFVQRLHAEGVTDAAIVGRVTGPGPGRVHVTTNGTRSWPAPSAPIAAPIAGPPPTPSGKEESAMTAESDDVPCCADALDNAGAQPGTAPASGVDNVQHKYHDFLKAASTPGALDAYTKQAISIALSVLARCKPCLKMHIKKAREKGFSDAEIDEAAWMAIAFGGSPLMMFYNELRKNA